MLLSLPYKNGDVVSLKLSSGEEIIAKLTEETTNDIVLSRPLMIAATQQGLGLAPFMFSVPNDTKFKINASSVLCIAKSDEEFAKQYTENTTGIAIV